MSSKKHRGGRRRATVREQPTTEREQQTENLQTQRASTLKVGDTVTRIPVTFSEYEESASRKSHGARLKLTGTVVYIHPAGRFHTVEFALRGGKVREPFLGA